MKSIVKTNNSVRNDIIHKSLKFIANAPNQAGQLYGLNDLAIANDIPLTHFTLYFSTVENFLISCVERAEMLFNRFVKSMIATSTFTGHDKICYFLRCVERFFEQYPEFVFLFKMHYSKEVLLGEIYSALEHFFELWHETLSECLQGYGKPIFESRIIQAYLILLKGQLYLADIKNINQKCFYADNFLSFVTYKELDEL